MARHAVSFVVTVYDKEPYLAAVLRAIAAQEGDFEREVIVVDDGSRDRSRAILAALGPRLPGFRLIAQPNCGPAIATNRGVAAAAMPFVKLVDGDDLLAPYATEHLIEAAERLGAEVAIGAGGAYPAGAAPYWPGLAAAPPALLADPLARLIRSIWFTPSNMLIRRAAWQQSGGCDERVFVQDYALALRLAAACRFAVSDTVVMRAPAAAAGLSRNKAQILHDLNLALLLFLEDRPELPAHYCRAGLRRIAQRAWKWARREAGRGALSRDSLTCLGAALGGREAVWKSLDIFAASGVVRRRTGSWRK
ncbi:MAG TPA: glycosyltransferase family 2 protein [Stellaceae bacterium]|nr:glycosyltransferase family 2 protein [Stellaceae bacterium]